MKRSFPGRHLPFLLVIAVAGFLGMAGCASNDSDDSVVQISHEPGMPEPGQERFTSPEAAASSLKLAFQTKDRHELEAMFGSEGKELIFTGDRVQEDNDMEFYGDRMAESLGIDHPADNKAVLRIGKENYPYPIPLVQADGQWFFDTAAGKEELLHRQIGDDELAVIATCQAYVAAQKEYASKPRIGNVIQYAQHFISTPGKKDGLFWEVRAGEPLSPMGPEVAAARAEGYDVPERPLPGGKRHPYHGYYFHILKAQSNTASGGQMDYVVNGHMTKGFALIAWPDKYRVSGVMTFIVNQDGKVYSKNLGPDTAEIVKTITEYNPDASWKEEKD